MISRLSFSLNLFRISNANIVCFGHLFYESQHQKGIEVKRGIVVAVSLHEMMHYNAYNTLLVIRLHGFNLHRNGTFSKFQHFMFA